MAQLPNIDKMVKSLCISSYLVLTVAQDAASSCEGDNAQCGAEVSNNQVSTMEPSNTELEQDALRCRLLALAAELRNRIYELTLVVQPSIKICVNATGPTEEGIQPGLTRTCRQIRRESLPMFYALNTFRFTHTKDRHGLRPGVGLSFGLATPHVHHMRIIEIAICFHGRAYTLDLSKGLQNFELTMILTGSNYDPYDEEETVRCFVNGHTLETAHEWLKCRVKTRPMERMTVQTLEDLVLKLTKFRPE